MKFLFLAVALVHCAFAMHNEQKSNDVQGGAQKKDYYHCAHPVVVDGGLDDPVDESLILISGGDQPMRLKVGPSRVALIGDTAQEKDMGADDLMVRSNFLKNTLTNDKTAKEIPLNLVEGPVLQLVCEYLVHHKGGVVTNIAKPIRSVKMVKIVQDPVDAHFMRIKGEPAFEYPADYEGEQYQGAAKTKAQIFQIILAANYLDIKSLLHLGCAKIATLIKGKSPEEIKTILGDDGTCDADGTYPKAYCPKCQEILKDNNQDTNVLDRNCPQCLAIQRRRRRRLFTAMSEGMSEF